MISPETTFLRPMRRIAAAALITLAASSGNKSAAGEVVPLSDCEEWTEDNPQLVKKLQNRPMVVAVDGTCDPNPDAPIGIYPEPSQEGESVAQLYNGDLFMVECVYLHGQDIQDSRGQISRSDKWIFGVTEAGEEGYGPIVWFDYPDTSGLKPC